MDELIEAIRTATSAEATDVAREAGANACRTLLAVFAAKPGEALVTSTSTEEPSLPPQTHAPTSPNVAAQVIASMLRGMTPDQLLDIAIARLRAALPAGTEVPQPQAVKFQLIPFKR